MILFSHLLVKLQIQNVKYHKYYFHTHLFEIIVVKNIKVINDIVEIYG